MQEKRDAVPCYRDYVIKDGVFVGKFEEMYRDIPDPWGCVEKVNGLSNRLLRSLLHEYASRDRALDVGCGMGALARLIAEAARVKEMYACDISVTAIEKAKTAVSDVNFFVHDLDKDPSLPFSDGYFSLITMTEVVWYILPVLTAVCGEFHRLLSPSGRLVIKQSFLPAGQQKYGREIISNPENLLQFICQSGMSPDREILLSELGGDQVYILSARKSGA